jgi:hypothetical protein
MKDIIELEVIQINTKDGKLVATLSYKDLTDSVDFDICNNGYRTIEAPINIRDFQLSTRGNLLVDQSVKEDSINETMYSDKFLKSIDTIEKNLKRS